MKKQIDLEKLAATTNVSLANQYTPPSDQYSPPLNSQYSPYHYLQSISRTPLENAYNQAVRDFEKGGPTYWMTDKMRTQKR